MALQTRPAMATKRARTWTPERIRQLRKRLKLSQSEFAERLGYTRYQTVSDFERGERPAPRRTILLLDMLEAEANRQDAEE